MKNKKLILCIVAVAIAFGGAVYYHFSSLSALRADAQEKEKLLNRRIEEIKASSQKEKESLLKKIDDLIAKQVVVFDSGTIQEEIKDIGQLATVEYRYTNVGTLDGSKKFKVLDLTVPLSKKGAIMTMDGVLKAGIDFSSVKISNTDDTITVVVPKARVLSNELVEKSLNVYEEKDGLFNKITLEDDSAIRQQIKDKAQQSAIDNGLLQQAKKNAIDMLRYMIEAIPGVKDNYTIVFK